MKFPLIPERGDAARRAGGRALGGVGGGGGGALKGGQNATDLGKIEERKRLKIFFGKLVSK